MFHLLTMMHDATAWIHDIHDVYLPILSYIIPKGPPLYTCTSNYGLTVTQANKLPNRRNRVP